MARPIWTGTISFGLLNIPVQLFSGERSTDVHFKMLDGRNRKPIRYERVNADTGEEVPWKDVVKAFEYEKGNYVVIDKEDIRKASPAGTETVEIEAFVDRDAISPLYFEKPYYLVPGKKAEKGYVLLREVLKRKGKVGIAKVVIRTRQYLAAVMPVDDALVLNLMRFPQELVPASEFSLPEEAPARHRISTRELDMAEQLLESMASEWRPEDYTDDFNDRLRELINSRIEAEASGRVHIEPEGEPPPANATTNVVDFMALLKQSLGEKGTRAAGKPHPAAARDSTASGAAAGSTRGASQSRRSAAPAAVPAAAKGRKKPPPPTRKRASGSASRHSA